jgi:hypothetical protein
MRRADHAGNAELARRSWKGDAVLWQVQDRLSGAGVLKFAHTSGGIDQAKQEALGWVAAIGGAGPVVAC